MATSSPIAAGPQPVSPQTVSITDDAVLIEEAEALALFIARRGDMLGDDQARKDAYEALRDAIAPARAGVDGADRTLLDAYAKVSAFTYGELEINGRTVLDTEGKGPFSHLVAGNATSRNRLQTAIYRLFKPRCRPLLLGGTLLFLVAAFEGVLLITGTSQALVELHKTLIAAKVLLLPLVWGALGTCTFLMKRISDKLSAFAFEEARARGMGTRVFLGAILGLIVVELLAKELGGFPKYLIAFMAGLGVKPVYAAIEGLVEGIASRIQLPTDTKKK